MTLEGLSLSATLRKITTTVDGGWSVTFDVPDSEKASIMELAAMRADVLQVAVVPHPRIQQEVE